MYYPYRLIIIIWLLPITLLGQKTLKVSEFERLSNSDFLTSFVSDDSYLASVYRKQPDKILNNKGTNLIENHPAPNLNCSDGVTLISQKTDEKVGSGAAKIPSISNLNIPTGDNRAVFILVNFEREHCQSGDNCTNSNTSGVGLGDNFACPTYLSGTYQITADFSGIGGAVSYENPLTSPDGDLRFGFQAGFPTPPTSNFSATFHSRESYFIAIYESDINTILGGNSSGNIDITLPNVIAPLDDADEAIMYAFVFENVEQNNFGIVRSGVNTALDNITSSGGGLAGNFSITVTDFDNTQEPDEAGDGLLVLGVSGLGGSNIGGFKNITGYTKVAENKITNVGGHFTTYNEADGFSAAVYFRNGPSSGIINNVTIQSAASSGLIANGGMLFVFTIESATCPLVEICNNGIDDDGDSLIDCDDSDCNVGTPGPIILD
ncbi:MAG: hypothetical protein AB8G11_09510 [Saprospiraceae bacterium]